MYDIYERSTSSGKPLELYCFIQNNTVIATYTSYGINITHNSHVYTPIPISRTQLEQSQELAANSITVTMPHDTLIASKYIAFNPSSPIWLIVYRTHATDATDKQFVVCFVGRILSVTFTDKAELRCAPIHDILQHKVPRIVYQSGCNHVLFSPYCGVIQGNYYIVAQITAINNSTLTSPAFGTKPNNWLSFGFAMKGNDIFRMIATHTGNNIEILGTFPDLSVGDFIEVYAGCDRTEAACAGKFNNRINYLGWTYIPTKNPFSGGIT